MHDPKWLAKDKVLVDNFEYDGHVKDVEVLSEIVWRAHTHIDELRGVLIDVLNGYTRLAVEKNRPEMPRAHVLADTLLYREEPPAVKR